MRQLARHQDFLPFLTTWRLGRMRLPERPPRGGLLLL